MITVGLDHTLFLQIFQFLLVVFLTNKLIVKPIKGTMDARGEKIDKLLSEADAQVKAVEESRLSYEAKLKDIRGEIAEYQRKVKEETSAKVNVALGKAKEEISLSTSKSRKELESAVDVAKKELQKEVGSLSELIYKKISGTAA